MMLMNDGFDNSWRETARQFGLLMAGAILCAMLAMVLQFRTVAAQITAGEHQVKASYLYNFGVFNEWPTNRFGSADAPFVFGVISSPDVAKALEEIARAETIRGRRLSVRRLNESEDLQQCHILFIAGSRDPGPVLGRLGALSGVLTVGEQPAFVHKGGMVSFVRVGENVKFHVNKAAADRAGIRISHELLDLAVQIVNRTP